MATTNAQPFFAGLGLGVKVRKDPTLIAEDALNLFEKAQSKITDAQNLIQKQIDEDDAEIRRLEEVKKKANGELSRLDRVAARIRSIIE